MVKRKLEFLAVSAHSHKPKACYMRPFFDAAVNNTSQPFFEQIQ